MILFLRVSRPSAVLCAAFIFSVSTVFARTVVLNAEAADRMAAIHEEGSRLSWAAHTPRAGQFDTAHIDLTPASRFMISYDLSVIPTGQRIIHAELSVPVSDFTGNDPRLFLWRMAAEWGAGVCHDFRMLRPEQAEWTVPGGRGAGSDRALHPTSVLGTIKAGIHIMNVTADVAMWYQGLAPNHGWMLGVDDPGVRIRLPSPVRGDEKKSWTLRITYEPER